MPPVRPNKLSPIPVSTPNPLRAVLPSASVRPFLNRAMPLSAAGSFSAPWVASARRNRLKEIYTSLCARGKAKKLALIACARKALVWAWSVFIQDTPLILLVSSTPNFAFCSLEFDFHERIYDMPIYIHH